MELEISTYIANKGHCPSIIALGRTYYPANHPLLTEEFLTWFYLDNPAGPATLVVAKEGDLWIGLVALIPVVLEYSGKLQRACYAVNVLTHPDHRTKNLFIKMIHYARDQLSKDDIWLLGHPNANAFPGWRRQKMAFRDPLRLYIAKFRLPFSFISIQRIYSLEMLRTIPASFFANLANRQDVHVKYSPEYIGWRFLNAPHREYNVAVVSYCGELLGLRVTRRFKGCVDLAVDFICPST